MPTPDRNSTDMVPHSGAHAAWNAKMIACPNSGVSDLRSTAAGSGGASRRLWSIVEPLDLASIIDRSTKHFDGRPFLLLERQFVPGDHRLLQCWAIVQNTAAVVQRRRLRSIDVDFLIVAHQGPHSCWAARNKTETSQDRQGESGTFSSVWHVGGGTDTAALPLDYQLVQQRNYRSQ